MNWLVKKVRVALVALYDAHGLFGHLLVRVYLEATAKYVPTLSPSAYYMEKYRVRPPDPLGRWILQPFVDSAARYDHEPTLKEFYGICETEGGEP